MPGLLYLKETILWRISLSAVFSLSHWVLRLNTYIKILNPARATAPRKLLHVPAAHLAPIAILKVDFMPLLFYYENKIK